MKIFSYICSLFLQNKCFWCQKSGHFFCPQCNKKLEVYSPYCYVCKKDSDDFLVHKECKLHFPIDQIMVLTRYRFKWIKRLLRHAKYYGKYSAYGDIMFKNKDFFIKYVDWENSILIPVPMHFLRR
jgi:predicted amidophosphoribosyltransferase